MGMHLWGGRPGAVSKRNFSLVRVVRAGVFGTPPNPLRTWSQEHLAPPQHCNSLAFRLISSQWAAAAAQRLQPCVSVKSQAYPARRLQVGPAPAKSCC